MSKQSKFWWETTGSVRRRFHIREEKAERAEIVSDSKIQMKPTGPWRIFNDYQTFIMRVQRRSKGDALNLRDREGARNVPALMVTAVSSHWRYGNLLYHSTIKARKASDELTSFLSTCEWRSRIFNSIISHCLLSFDHLDSLQVVISNKNPSSYLEEVSRAKGS